MDGGSSSQGGEGANRGSKVAGRRWKYRGEWGASDDDKGEQAAGVKGRVAVGNVLVNEGKGGATV